MSETTNGWLLLIGIAVMITIIAALVLTMATNVEDSKFALSTASDICPGVPQLNWLNDTTLTQSVVYGGVCMFPTKREQEEGCVDWHKTRLNFERKCKELQAAQGVKQ